MRYFVVAALTVVAAAAQAAQIDIPIPSSDIATVEVTKSTVQITFSLDAQSDALAADREMSIHIDFQLPGAKSLFMSQARYVANRLAAISFKLPSPEDAQQFAQGIRDGRIRLASHPKRSNHTM